jgi:hypothetical protein
VQSGTTVVAGRPQVLFEFATVRPGLGFRPYDIAPDGRFLIIGSGQAEAGVGTEPQIVVVQNWFEELKRLVPVSQRPLWANSAELLLTPPRRKAPARETRA